MPRLFWKLFLALWLSIMGFAAVMAWINASLVAHEPPDMQIVMFQRTVDQFRDRLTRSLRRDDLRAAKEQVDGLPRNVRRHVYVLDGGRELLGRDRQLRDMRERRKPSSETRIESRSGHTYELILMERMPPISLFEPGWRGGLHRLLLAAVVSALVSAWLAHYLSRPLGQLGSASRKLAQGDLGARVGEPMTARRDEFGQLARDLDDMAGRLQDLQDANRRLLRDVSHELRSPLARMRVALEIARNRDDGGLGGELDRMELEAERLETLVGEVLDLLRESSQSIPLNVESFDLEEFLSDLRDLVVYEAGEAGPGVELAVEGEIVVRADRELLWRAVENLLRNALLHTGSTSAVRLVARVERDEVVICVADRGPGLPPPQLERIFEPFYRVQESRDRQSGGHGLGLAIAAAAVRRHRGSIAARNRERGGLEFCIRLPGEPG